ncbi:MAG: TldD/PmbA family protein [bacterium]
MKEDSLDLALDLADRVTRKAKTTGADQCDCYIETGRELAIKVRDGEIETIERASFRGLGVRFFTGHRLGFGFTTDFSRQSLEDLVERCRALAEAATPDPDAGIPEPHPVDCVDLEISDPAIDGIPLERKTEHLLACEAAARAVDKRIQHFYSAAYEERKGRIVIARMDSEPISYDSTTFETFCAPIAEEAGEKRMGIWASDARFFEDLESAALTGQTAARRALAMLGAKTPRTCKLQVVFDPLAGTEVVAEIFGALDGERVTKGMSFLRDRIGQKAGSDAATFVDDGRIVRKIGSRPFDAEGIPTKRVAAIDKGTVKSYFFDYRSAAKAGASPTGNARRGFSSVPGVGENNFYLIPGKTSRDDLLGRIEEGLLVTRMIGFGVNLTTGDFSRGAEGLWIKNGRLAQPVDGITVGGNLADMLAGIETASDLRFFGRLGSPTFTVGQMTIAGE